MKSVAIGFCYRDFDNWKAHGEVVVRNPEDLDLKKAGEALRQAASFDDTFIAEQVGFPEIFLWLEYEVSEDDTCWHELSLPLHETDAPPTDARTLKEVIEAFSAAAQAGWQEFDPLERVSDLTMAASKGELDRVNALLNEPDSELHVMDDLALRLAVQHGHLPVVQTLVASGADIHVRNDYVLSIAAQQGDLAMLEFLLERGCTIDANGGGAILEAILMNQCDAAARLLRDAPERDILLKRCWTMIRDAPSKSQLARVCGRGTAPDLLQGLFAQWAGTPSTVSFTEWMKAIDATGQGDT